MTTTNLINLRTAELCLALFRRFGRSVHYNKVRDAMISGAIPATRSPIGTFSVSLRDLPAVARYFGIDRRRSA
jgi:hypothetical protein